MNVCLFMFYDDKIKHYGDINARINKTYCEKYNIDFIFSNEKKYNNRHPAWERLPLLLANIRKYDYLVWIDADAFFYYDAMDIRDVINDNDDTDFIFSRDKGNIGINTGVFIVRNTPYSIDFLTRWAYDEELYRNNPFPIFWDQGVLMGMHRKNMLDIRHHSVILDYGVLQHFQENEKLRYCLDKPYILHLAGENDTVRFNTSLKYHKCDH